MTRPLHEIWPTDKRLVLGIGCGRTGSESLGFLLNAQPGVSASHEFSLFSAQGHRAVRHRPPLAWDASREEFADAVRSLGLYPQRVVGDAASYWLPCLDWLLEELPETRVIGVTRPRESVVRSFLAKSGDRNHWSRPGLGEWAPDPTWDPCFPKYDTADKAEAIGLYWDEYYGRCDELVARWPERVRLWPLPALSDRDAVREMLLFAGCDPATINLSRLGPRNQRKSLLRRWAKRLLRGGKD